MAIGQISVLYNGYTFSPTPLVSESYEPLIVQGQVWGHVVSITLDGYLTGLKGNSNDYENLASIFSTNFSTLTVNDITSGTNQLYSWSNIVVDNISIDQSNYPINGFVKYSIQLKSYSDITSGVVNPTNEYSFTQNEDGTVDCNHKISAQGVRTSTDPLSNAINFVSLFEKKNPYTNCATFFIPNGYGILLATSESINRVDSIYTVVEKYKFVTGSTNNYTQVSTLNIDQSSDKDYITLDYNSKYQVSPLTGNLASLVTSLNGNNYLNEIANTYSISTTNIYQNTFSIIQDSGAGTVEVKNNFVSGLNGDISGYFDIVSELEKDLVMQKNTWKVNAEWVGKGPLSFRQTNLNNFIVTNSPFQSFLENIITTSPLALQYGNVGVSQVNQVLDYNWEQNTGMAIFKTSINTRDLDPNYANLINPKFSINFQPPKWQYEIIPSSTIEGAFIIQDLQVLTNSKLSISVQSASSGNNTVNFLNLPTLFNNLSGSYIPINTGFNTKLMIESGILDKSIEGEWVFRDLLNGTLFSTYKIYGSLSSNFIRPKGYYFGH